MFKRDPNLLHILTHKLYLLHSEIRSIAWRPDGAWLAGGTDEDAVKLWSTSDGKVIKTLRPTGLPARLKGLFNGVSSVAWSRSGTILAVSYDSGALRIWQSTNDALARTLPKFSGGVSCIALRLDDSELAAAGSDSIQIYDLAAGNVVRGLVGHQSSVQSIAYNPTGAMIASGGADKTVRVWDAASGRQHAVFAEHQRRVHVVAWSPDGSLLASGSTDGTVRLWRVADGACAATLTCKTIAGVNALAWSPDGERLACGGYGADILVWRVPQGTLERSLTYRWGQDRVHSLAWHRDGTLLASGGVLGGGTKFGTVLVWRVDAPVPG